MEERAKEEKTEEEGETTVGFGNNEVSACNTCSIIIVAQCRVTCASRLQN